MWLARTGFAIEPAILRLVKENYNPEKNSGRAQHLACFNSDVAAVAGFSENAIKLAVASYSSRLLFVALYTAAMRV